MRGFRQRVHEQLSRAKEGGQAQTTARATAAASGNDAATQQSPVEPAQGDPSVPVPTPQQSDGGNRQLPHLFEIPSERTSFDLLAAGTYLNDVLGPDRYALNVRWPRLGVPPFHAKMETKLWIDPTRQIRSGIGSGAHRGKRDPNPHHASPSGYIPCMC